MWGIPYLITISILTCVVRPVVSSYVWATDYVGPGCLGGVPEVCVLCGCGFEVHGIVEVVVVYEVILGIV